MNSTVNLQGDYLSWTQKQSTNYLQGDYLYWTQKQSNILYWTNIKR